jgi:polygalacturonase
MTNYAHIVAVILLPALSLLFGTFMVAPPSTEPSPVVESAVISVRSFGAKGDGVHDDFPNIQRAINFMGRTGHHKITFEPFATYRLSKALNLRNTREIELDGQQATLKPLDDAQAVDEQGGILYAANVHDLLIRDLRFDGNRMKRGPSPFPCRAQAIMR